MTCMDCYWKMTIRMDLYTNLKIVHTNGGRDDISEVEHNALLEVWWAAAGYTFMIEDGHFKIQLALAS